VEGTWDYSQNSGYQAGADLTGFTVEATDGRIGKIDKHSGEAGAGYIVVDTGVWIFGKHVLLPAGLISSIDVTGQVVHVDRTKDEIKDAPEFDPEKHTADPDYHEQVGSYYRTGL
jgi:hypothetical protein